MTMIVRPLRQRSWLPGAGQRPLALIVGERHQQPLGKVGEPGDARRERKTWEGSTQARRFAYKAGSKELTTNALGMHKDFARYITDVRPDEDQIEFYRTNGFVVLDGVLDGAQLQTWREVIDAAVGVRGEDWTFPNKGQADVTNVEMDFYKKVFTQRINLWVTDKAAQKLLLSSQAVLARAACLLSGVSKMRLWHDQALYKEPWANATSWHLDVPYWSFDSSAAISAWVALDDATLANGCMHFIPGSHTLAAEEYKQRGSFREIKIGKNMSDVFSYYPTASKMQTRAVEMKAGSVSFHSGTLIHGAGPNMTANRRRAMTVAYMPDGMAFNGKQNVLTGQQLRSLQVGDMLTDDEQNPLLYQM